MILMTKLELGQAEQTIYAVEGNSSRKIASVDLMSLSGTLSGLYYTNQAEKILIQGPNDYAKDIEEDTRCCYLTTYGNREIDIEII